MLRAEAPGKASSLREVPIDELGQLELTRRPVLCVRGKGPAAATWPQLPGLAAVGPGWPRLASNRVYRRVRPTSTWRRLSLRHMAELVQ